MKYRIFWVWDHLMDWIPGALGVHNSAKANWPYGKGKEAFLEDCTRLAEYMGAHNLNGIVIYGLLRDNHGGLAAAREVCHRFAQNGVRVLPGCCVMAYGGPYYDGVHEFNLNTWLKDYPELQAVGTDGKPLCGLTKKRYIGYEELYQCACPSRPATQDWYKRGIDWLFDNLEIGGIYLENAEYGICQCNECNSLRWSKGKGIPLDYMAGVLTPYVKYVRENFPKAWVICSHGGYQSTEEEMLGFIEKGCPVPADCICDWGPDMWLRSGWKNDFHPPGKEILVRTGFAEEWENDTYTIQIEKINLLVRRVAELELAGCAMFGQKGAFHPPNEINYLAFEEFTTGKNLDLDVFIDNTLAELLGGREEARLFLELEKAPRTVCPECQKINEPWRKYCWNWGRKELLNRVKAESVTELGNKIARARDVSKNLPGNIYHRWNWLIESLFWRVAEAKTLRVKKFLS